MDLKDAITLMAFVLAVGVNTWGIIRYLVNRIDERHEKAMGEIVNLNRRVDDHFVKRTELDRDLQSVYKSLELIRADIKAGAVDTNHRLDNLIKIISKTNS